MTLDQFRKSKGWSYAQLAKLTGCAHATVARRWCLPVNHPAKSVPGVRYMKAISVLTDGAVQPNSFYPLGLND